MAVKYILGASVASFAVAFACDHFISDKKIFGGMFWWQNFLLINSLQLWIILHFNAIIDLLIR